MDEQHGRPDRPGIILWMLRHKVWTGVIAFFALTTVLGIANPSPKTENAAKDTPVHAATKTSSPAADPSIAAAPVVEPPGQSAAPATTTAPTSGLPAATAVPSPVAAPASAGQLNHTLTPGSVFAGTMTATICVSGYSASVRNVTTATRQAVFAAYGISYPPPTGAYELDHLIPLELGGDNTARNLWPEPYHGAGSANVKDHLENHLHALVCAGQVGLRTAQTAIAGDWATAAARYNGVSVSRPPAPAPARPTPKPTTRHTSPPVAPGGGATALCNDGTLSYAAHHQGACSHHGGVAVFYK